MSKIKFKSLRLEGFRGIHNLTELPFGNDCHSIVLHGYNATGKSSFAEGIEWFIYGEIEKLRKEGCGKKDFRHVSYDKKKVSFVELETIDGLMARREIDAKGHEQIPTTINIEEIAGDNIILNQPKLKNFVEKTKTEKLGAVLDITGYEKIGKIRDELKRAVSVFEKDTQFAVLKDRIEQANTLITKRITESIPGVAGEIAELLAKNELEAVSVTAVSAIVNKHKKRLKGGSGGINEAIDQFEKLLEKDETGKLLQKIEQLISKLEGIALAIQKPKDSKTEHICGQLNNLFKDKAALDKLALTLLYKTGKHILAAGITSGEVCPLCETTTINKERFIADLEIKIKKNEAIETSIKELETQWSSILGLVSNLSSNLKDAQTFLTDNSEIKTELEDVVSPDVDLLKQKFADRISLDAAEVSQLSEFPNKVAGNVQACLQKLKGIENRSDKSYLDIAKDLESLKTIRDGLAQLEKSNSELAYLSEKLNDLRQIYELFAEFEQEALVVILARLSEDTARYYSFLHKGDNHDGIKLEYHPKARGLVFKIIFHGYEIEPPVKVLSESHLNTLGLCFFLASSRYFNRATSFIVLDDIASSIDINHRRALAELIREEFSDTQFLILTHEKGWFRILNKALVGGKWKFFEIVDWKLESILIEPIKDVLEVVDGLIGNNNAIGVEQHLRNALLKEVKRLCTMFKVPIPYRGSSYQMEDMWQPLCNYLKNDTFIDPTSSHKGLFNDIFTNRFLFNIALHDPEDGDISPGDMKKALEKYVQFLSLFRCSECTKPIRPSKEGFECKCGHVFSSS